MTPPLFADQIFFIVAVGTALIAGYLGVVNRNYASALQVGAISTLWLSVTLINGYQDILVSIIAIGTLVLVWAVTQSHLVERP